MAISKLTTVMLVVCFLAVIGYGFPDGKGHGEKNGPKSSGHHNGHINGHHLVKRQADYEEEPYADGYDNDRYENSHERSHRIRVLPGFLH